MKQLDSMNLKKIDEVLLSQARPVDIARYNFYIKDGHPSQIYQAMEAFQNSDGGFGHGMESDLRLPDSSPIATSVAIRYLLDVDKLSEVREMLRKTVAYLEATYDRKNGRWWTADEKLNDYPHAPWWHFDHTKQATPIDGSLGNPSAELLGYLFRYKDMVKTLDVEKLIDEMIAYWCHKETFDSEHETFCFIRMYGQMDMNRKAQLEESIRKAISTLIKSDPTSWEGYVPEPLKFLEYYPEDFFGIKEAWIENNLDYLVDKMKKPETIKPQWQWGMYEEAWEEAKKEWTGSLMLDYLVHLKKFGRLVT